MNTDRITRGTGKGGMPCLRLRSADGHRAEIYPHGATVTAWQTPSGDDLLFTSSEALFQEGKAIRGGVPVIFPQFSGMGPLPAHGLVRAVPWEIADVVETPDGRTEATFIRSSDAATKKVWDYDFELSYVVSVGPELTITMTVDNTSKRPFEFQFALHSYFTVSDIDAVRIPGLRGLTYLDNTKNREPGREDRDLIEIAGEVDRVYVNAPDTLEIRDTGAKRAIVIKKEGMRDAVLWNPWIEKAQKLSDLGDDEYQRFVCLECGAIAEKTMVAPGQSAVLVQTVSYRAL